MFISRAIRSLEPEALIWTAALLYLASVEPDAGGHFTFCIFSIFGFENCPGCGLGHSISYLFHGDIITSFYTHPLGIATVLVLTTRIISLTRKSIVKLISDFK